MNVPAPITAPQLLAALYEGARPQGMGWFHAKSAPLTEAEAEEAIKQNRGYIDYLHGRPIKIDFRNFPEVDPRLYDRDAGQGAFDRVISYLTPSGEKKAEVTISVDQHPLPF